MRGSRTGSGDRLHASSRQQKPLKIRTSFLAFLRSGKCGLLSVTCGFTADEFGFNHDLAAGIGAGIADAAEQGFGRDASHFAQRLANCRQRGILVSGALDIVEPDDGDIFRNL